MNILALAKNVALAATGTAALHGLNIKMAVTSTLSKEPPYHLTGGPLVSVVIPTIQEEGYLPYLFTSIYNQTYGNTEVVVSDSTAPDKVAPTQELVAAWSSVLPIKLVSIAKKNVSAGRNFGAANANGEVLLFMDADCIMNHTYIEQLVGDLANHRLVHGTDGMYNNDVFNTIHSMWGMFKPRLWTTGRGVMIRAADFAAVGGYREDFDPYISNAREDLQLGKDVEAMFGPGSVYLNRWAFTAESARRPWHFTDGNGVWDHRGYRRDGQVIDSRL